MAHDDVHEGHGNSVAAWVSVTVVFLGFLLGCLGVAMSKTAIAIVGAVLVVIGAILWPVLARMGYGDKNPVRSLYS